jgi:DNA-binding MarR family transcriptional regulator
MPHSSRAAEPITGPDRGTSRKTDESEPLGLFTTLARTGLFLEALQRECLSEHGLAFTEYSVLRLLQRASGRRRAPSVLAERIVCTTGAMTKLVDRLQRSGLVERRPDPHDRRGVLVQLTPEGNRTTNAAGRVYIAGRRRILKRLDEREAKRVHKSLERLLEALETDRSEQ